MSLDVCARLRMVLRDMEKDVFTSSQSSAIYLDKGKVWPHVYVLFFLLISWVIFAVTDLSQLGIILGRMFSFSAGTDWVYYLRNYAVTFAVAILFSTPLPWKLYCKVKDCTAVNLVLMGGVLVLSVAYLVDATYNPFLYFRF